MMPGDNSAAAPRRALWIPAIFVIAMLIVVAVNGWLAYVATTSFSGLDTEHAYSQGLVYNDALADAAKSAALGWQVEARLDRRSLRVDLRDRDGRPLAGLRLIAYLTRPATTAFDRQAELAPLPGFDGRYTSAIDLPTGGAWDLRLVARRGAEDWQWTQRILLSP